MTLKATGLIGETVCVEKEMTKYVVRMTKETLVGRPTVSFDLGEGVIMNEAISDALLNIERLTYSLVDARTEILEYLKTNGISVVDTNRLRFDGQEST